MSLGGLMKDNSVKISALYDSHVHWLLTGEKQSYFDLQKYQTLSEINPNSFSKKNYRGHWLFAYGWNDSQLSMEKPFQELDRLSLTEPICFIKKDAHSCILNSAAMKMVLETIQKNESAKQFIEIDASGKPTGLFKESAYYLIYQFIPKLSKLEIRTSLLEAQYYFLKNGFTHIRDMTCSQAQWQVLKELQASQDLKIFADINFNVDSFRQAIDETLPFLLKEFQFQQSNLKIKGIKIFYDGSLGSQTALLFENYKGTSDNGNSLWSDVELYELMKLTWQNGFEFSVHTLGDKAVDKVVDVARKLYAEKVRGYLNLEHVQLVRPDTITKMKSLFVRCHMQPSHWLSDKKFLNERLNTSSLKNIFAWEALRRAKVPISFGSDSPIEKPDIALTHQALVDSKNFGIEEFKGAFFDFYKHPERSGKPMAAVTYINEFKPISLIFPNDEIFLKEESPPTNTQN